MRALVLLLALSGAATAAPLRDLGVGWTGFCAVDAKGAVTCTEEANTPQGAPAARAIALGYNLVILDEKGKVFVWDDLGQKLVDLALPFVAKQIGFVSAELCAFGTRGELACGTPEPNRMTLHEAPKDVRFVSATFASKSIYLLDDKRNLWCEGGSACARLRHAFTKAGSSSGFDHDALRGAYPIATDKVSDVARWKIASNVTRIAAGGDICMERPKQPLLCWDFAFGPRTYSFAAYDELITVGGQACRRKGDSITCTYLDPRLHEIYGDSPKHDAVTTTLKAKSATRLYANGDKLCVADSAGAVSCTKPAGNRPVPPLEPVRWPTR